MRGGGPKKFVKTHVTCLFADQMNKAFGVNSVNSLLLHAAATASRALGDAFCVFVFSVLLGGAVLWKPSVTAGG